MKNFTSCIKEKKFLRFFFNRLGKNKTERYPEFPYLSICGKERNFVRCDDYPIVFTHVFNQPSTEGEGTLHLAYNHAADLLSLAFEPHKTVMFPSTGRVYHPAPEKVGGIGLIRSNLALEWGKLFKFQNGESEPPTHFEFNGTIYKLDNEWYKQKDLK